MAEMEWKGKVSTGNIGEYRGISKRLVDENHKRERVANLTALSLERAGDAYKKMGE